MASRPNKPLAQCITEFHAAMDANDLVALEKVEKEIDAVVYARLRRLRYKGYSRDGLNAILSDLPEDYQGKALEKLFNILDNISPVHR